MTCPLCAGDLDPTVWHDDTPDGDQVCPDCCATCRRRDPRRLLALARSACARFRRDRDRADLVQDAAAHILTLGPMPDPHVVVRTRSHIIDLIRRRDGTRRQGRWIRFPDRVDPQPVRASTDLGLEGQQAVVVDLLAEGWRTGEIAQALGVTSARVCHIKTTIRQASAEPRSLPRAVAPTRADRVAVLEAAGLTGEDTDG